MMLLSFDLLYTVLMLRPLSKLDLEQLLLVEEAVHITPWTRETFQTCFDSGYTGFVAENTKRVIGFVMVSNNVGECHILNLCVLRQYQHHGYGTQLLNQALEVAKKQGAGIAYLEVRRTNYHAIALYRKMKFQLVGERKDYYATVSGFEDALVFAKSLYEE